MNKFSTPVIKRLFIPSDNWKNWWLPPKFNIFSMVLGLRTNSELGSRDSILRVPRSMRDV